MIQPPPRSASAFADAHPPEQAVPAATLILARPSAGGVAAEVLLLRRVDTMAFAPGAMVFPGGRVDRDDHSVAAHLACALEPDDAAARVAAIRETLEETGLTIGMTLARADERRALRAALLDGAPLSAWVMRGDVTIDLDRLIPFARWCPNFRETRTFDTRFYRAVVGADDSDGASVVEREHDSLGWHSPAEALDAIDRGDMTVIFPTHRNLEKLSIAPNHALLSRDHDSQPIPLIVPFVDVIDDVRWLCIPPGLGYPVTAVPLEQVRRT